MVPNALRQPFVPRNYLSVLHNKLVFSTLHTRDVTGSVTRILDYFPEGRQSEVRNQLSLGLAYLAHSADNPIMGEIGHRSINAALGSHR